MGPPPTENPPSRRPLVESPWFWLYVFSTAALAGILLIGPKYFRREATLERKAEARQDIAMRRAGAERVAPQANADKPAEAAKSLNVPLRWLLGIVALVVVVSMVGLRLTMNRAARLSQRKGQARAMTWMLEDPWPAIILGGIVTIVFVVMAFQSGRGVFLGGAAAALAVTGLFWLLERLVVTPREEVEGTLYAMAEALEQNDAEGLAPHISTTAPRLLSSVRSELRRFTVEQARVASGLEILLHEEQQPATARASFFGLIRLKDRRGQLVHESFAKRLSVEFRKEDGQWRMTGYTLGGAQ